jgi:subtilase family serine protease
MDLARFLTALSVPLSPLYHRYLTAAEFDSEYGGNATVYAEARAYFQSFGVANLQATTDRLTLGFQASVVQVQEAFHTTLDEFAVDGRSYIAPTASPELPAPLAAAIANVEGLSTYSNYLLHSGSFGTIVRNPLTDNAPSASPVDGYLPPVSAGGAQWEYAADFQVAYDELPLFQEFGYPSNEVIATIFVSGVNASYTPVGPFVPSDVYDFYNETLPAGEPHAHVYGVPLDGASPPGPSASYDITGSSFEDTLDLEMVGSTAPGASIYDVYGPGLSLSYLDSALSYVLNPTNTTGLANVSVISNSWGYYDQNDTTWYEDLQEAQARGITVLACSGDSGDYRASPKDWGGPDDLWFPSSMAYDTFGVLAVGGTTAQLNPDPSSPNFLELVGQSAWYNASGGVGSTGGVSSVFAEPSWQAASEAGSVIDSGGRGAPDIAAVANDTLMTLTVNGYQYQATNATYGGSLFGVWGTSIASPLEAGILAEIDRILAVYGTGWLGFPDPQLYALADEEFSSLSLPTDPLLDVTVGHNFVNSTLPGYDLVTGWGSIDAYNYTGYLATSRPSVYLLTFTETGLPLGTSWSVTVYGVPFGATNRTVTLNASGSSIVVSLPKGNFTFSLGPVSGYGPTPSRGTISVNGSAAAVPILFHPLSSNSALPWWVYPAIGVVVAGVAAAVAIAVMSRRAPPSLATPPAPLPLSEERR